MSDAHGPNGSGDGPLTRSQIAERVAADMPSGASVNLGIGRPTEVSNYLPAGRGVILHTENGMLGMGPEPEAGHEDPDLINAGKQPVTELAGAAYFHHADSFTMIRGRHLDAAVLGAYQVSTGGDLANWSTGEPDAIPAVGGAMDLALGATQVFVMMPLTTRDGASKLVADCSYPLTGLRCVGRVYTDQAVFDLHDRPSVIDTYGTTIDQLRELTGLDLVDQRTQGRRDA